VYKFLIFVLCLTISISCSVLKKNDFYDFRVREDDDKCMWLKGEFWEKDNLMNTERTDRVLYYCCPNIIKGESYPLCKVSRFEKAKIR
tara:strand:- start:1047 stop:1310 length:264 start_codon:yes stop_codon:yes gene_type:complete